VPRTTAERLSPELVRCGAVVATVRIRQWWYKSPSVEVTIVADEKVRLRGDIPRSMRLLRGMARFILHPTSSLVLEIS
jgi:hypothetical protein